MGIYTAGKSVNQNIVKMTWTSPRQGHDKDICPASGCRNIGQCQYPCAFIGYVNGQSQLKEALPKNDIFSHLPQPDYNAALAELADDAEARDIDRLIFIRECRDVRRKLLLAMALVGGTQEQISEITHLSQSRVSRIQAGK